MTPVRGTNLNPGMLDCCVSCIKVNFSTSACWLDFRLQSLATFSGIRLELAPNLITRSSESFQSFCFVSHKSGRIVETPMMALNLSRENRTSLIRAVTNSNHRLHFLLQKLVQVLRTMPRNINPD